MFEYRTRTETVNGCKFIQQDILLFDYVYSGDTETEVHLNYVNPGFGLVLVEAEGKDITQSENIYIFKLGARNEYQVITKQYMEQYTAKDEFIGSGVDIAPDGSPIMLLFKFTERYKLRCYYITKGNNGINNEQLLFTFNLPHDINNYKLGIYSNFGNTLRFASVKSEAPSNWVSNIFNANGGRINWYDNGFQIEDSEYDIEVESQNNILPAGKYFLAFDCNNPDMKYYVYPSEMRDTREVRPMDLILSTKEDEVKNILDYDTMSFELAEEHAVNIKFKAKWGMVKNIAVKISKEDDFVATDYNNLKREASYIRFDLDKIKNIEMTAVVTDLPKAALYEEPEYFIAQCGSIKLKESDLSLELNKEYTYIMQDNVLRVNDISIKLPKVQYLDMLKNVNAVISKLIVTMENGEVIDVILQKTIKITVNNTIDSPIIVTGDNGTPYDLSGSYRKVIQPKKMLECFGKFSQIVLKHKLPILNANIKIAGVLAGSKINLSKNNIDEAAENTLITPGNYTVDYKLNKIIMDSAVRNKYKYVLVEYNSCDNYKYEYTNYEREYFNLVTEQNLYIKGKVCDVAGPVRAYGLPKGATFYKERLYDVPSSSAVNSIDYCADLYTELSEDDYSISSSGKIDFAYGTRELYDYLIIDYLKDSSYAVNERNDYYEVDVATSEELVNVIYDSDDNGVTHKYSTALIGGLPNVNNFIVLRKD